MTEKVILDACCGSRMFWFDKKQPNTIYIDIREYDKGYIDNRPNRELHPDIIMDFKHLEFPDKKFKHIIVDPPPLDRKNIRVPNDKNLWCSKPRNLAM